MIKNYTLFFVQIKKLKNNNYCKALDKINYVEIEEVAGNFYLTKESLVGYGVLPQA